MHKPESTAHINRYIKDTIIGKAADQSARNQQFPLETATLAALAVASQVVSLNYKIAYKNRGTLPAGIYAIAEQPSGTGKSGVLSGLSEGLLAGIDDANKERRKVIAQIQKSKEDKGDYNEYELKDLEDNCLIPPPVTNTTPEALDTQLKKCGGWFCLASTEQGLLNTLVGGMYSEGKSNFDLMLKGFNAEAHNELRVTRESYQGLPHGSAICISQDGSIDTVLTNSGSTGLIERFLMIVEGDMLGHRERGDRKTSYGYIDQFNNLCREIMHNGFSEKRSLNYGCLKVLTISPMSWDLIETVQNEVEEHLAPGGKFRASILSSMWSKFDMQVMKVAAAIHVFSANKTLEIDADSTLAAIHIVKAIFNGVIIICEEKGIVGRSSEKDDVIEYLEKNGKMGKGEREILNALRARRVFKQYGKQARAKATEALQALCQEGVVSCTTTGDKNIFRLVI